MLGFMVHVGRMKQRLATENKATAHYKKEDIHNHRAVFMCKSISETRVTIAVSIKEPDYTFHYFISSIFFFRTKLVNETKNTNTVKNAV